MDVLFVTTSFFVLMPDDLWAEESIDEGTCLQERPKS